MGAAWQVSIPLWALVHLPVVVTLTTAIFTPRVSPAQATLHSLACGLTVLHAALACSGMDWHGHVCS